MHLMSTQQASDANEAIRRMAARTHEASKAFTPSAPVDDLDLFAGRISQVQQVMRGIGQKGQHILLYGERGVGKTSLANVLQFFLSRAPGAVKSLVVKVNCARDSTPASLWKSALTQINLAMTETGMGFHPPRHVAEVDLSKSVSENVSPEEIRQILQTIHGNPIFIFDEIDRLTLRKSISFFSDTIKTLSDNSVNATLLLVGVADSVGDLIKEHLSIERALIQVQMPRMSDLELQEIVTKGIKSFQMGISQQALISIASISQGLPHYAHLLALHASIAAINQDSNEISYENVKEALVSSVAQAQQSIKTAYHEAVSSPRGNLFPQVLLACALAHIDELGYFTSSAVREPMARIMKRAYTIAAFSRHLTDFCKKERGPILQKTGYRRRFRYRFINPLMEPYVIMKGISEGLIEEELWDFK